MRDLTIRTLDGGTAGIDADSLQALRGGLRGEAVVAGEPGHDEARTVWNAMIDRRPALVVRCRGASDVMQAVRFAGARNLLVAVRGGGHNIAGMGVCEGGVLIDLSAMRSVRVDRAAATAWAEPGATLGDFDRETQAFGLTTPLGINSTTGIAGLTLGGGFGWTTRRFGMTIDNLLSVDLVTAAGEMVRASEDENPDLFWAVRGGGGNFGVVTGFEYRLHRMGPEVLSGLIVHPLKDAPALLDRYRAFVATAPEALTAWIVARKAPPLPFLPAEWHGREVLVFAVCHAGEMAEGERAVAPLRAIGKPIADVIGPHPFTAWQAAFDPLLTPGARNYWKSHNFTALSDETCRIIVDYAWRLPTAECEIFVAGLGGAMAAVAPEATAYAGREAAFIMNVHTRWQDAADDARCIAWARDFARDTAPHASGGAYVNFLTEDEADRVTGIYGPNFDRLARVKARWDPGNLFRVNQNIAPDAAALAAE